MGTVQWGVQHRTYLDKGWEESTVDTQLRPGLPWTERTARFYVAAYNCNREDETGLPATRVVKRELPDWEVA